MSLDDRPEDPDQPPTPSTTPFVPRASFGLTLRVAVPAAMAVAAVRLWDVPTAVAVPAAVLLAALAVVPHGATSGARGHRFARRVERPIVWPDAGIKAAVDAVDDPCVVTDATGAVRWFNRPASARLPTLSLGNPISFALRVRSLLDAVERVAAADGAPEIVEWQDKVPTERWSRAHVAPLVVPAGENGVGRRFVLVRIEDPSEARRTERMRVDFVANASHELRTPLAALSGFIETLQGPARDDVVARQRFLTVMSEQAARMKRLIDDLLSLSRVEMKAHLRPETPIDLCEVVAQAVDLTRPIAAAAGGSVAIAGCGAPCVVRGDREELVQVFVNLIENAFKYGEAGGPVEVAVTAEGTTVAVAVRDHGPGIDPVHLPRLTERFYRAHTETAGVKRGTGLGLAIVKHVVTRHGGRLDIASRLGEGSTFTVVLDRVELVSDQRVETSSN